MFISSHGQIYSAKTKHINIVMYITMPIPMRAVMMELYLKELNFFSYVKSNKKNTKKF